MRVLIIGAGTGGLILANTLARKLSTSTEIILIEKSKNHYFQPGFTLLCFRLISEEFISRPVKDLLSKRVKLIQGEVKTLNPLTKEVTLSSGESINYDKLVISTGAELDWEKIPGISEGLYKGNIYEFYTLSGAKKLKEEIPRLKGGTIVSAIGGIPIKCPAAPIKFILLLEDYLRKKGLREKFKLIFITPAGQVLGRSPYAEKLENICKERNIQVIKNFQIKEVDVVKRKIKGEEEIFYDYLIFTPPHTIHKAFLEIPDFCDETGFIKVDPHRLQHKLYRDIFALGDVASLPTAKTASGTRLQAKVLAKKLSVFTGSKTEDSTIYDGEILCPVMTRFGKIMFSRYNYEKSLSPPKESRLNWMLHVWLGKYLYWQIFLKGF